MKWIINQADADGSTSLGGKAGALAALDWLALPIPPWFVVSPAAFTESAKVTKAEKLEDIVVCESVLAELNAAIAALCPNGERVAVRSSASDEDGAQHSFAGQLDSFLFVSAEHVAEKVAAVWRSGYQERILAYRREHGLSESPSPPTVLVQRMVDATSSGVAFSADPVTGDRGLAVIGAVYGLGTALVSGEADADTYSVDRTGKILKRDIANKTTAHRFDSSSSEGVTSVPLPPEKSGEPVLTDTQAAEVAELARTTARHFGLPQDIEWAIEGGKLYLLQSRPITSVAGTADPKGVLIVWDNSNIAESYGGVTTPLTFSFARKAYEEVYRQFLRILGVPADVISPHDGTLKRMLGLIQGRIYYNLISWHQALALLPGYALNRRFMEQMMGVKEELPAEGQQAIKVPNAGDSFSNVLRVGRSVVGLLRSHYTLPQSTKAFYARLETALTVHSYQLEDMRPDELADHYRDLEQRLLTAWDAPLVNDFFAMFYYGVLSRIVQKWCGDTNGTLQNDLLCGQGGVISAEPAKRIRDLAQIAGKDPEFVRCLCEDSWNKIVRAILGHPQFAKEYADYLDKFSDRCLNELKLESATLRDDPMFLLRSIGQVARSRGSSIEPVDNPAAEAESRAIKALASNPLRLAIFRYVLKNARGRIRDRENLRFERTRLFGHVRRIFVEIGKRFAADNIISKPRDIFYLEVEEILSYVEGTATTADFRGLISVRQKEFADYAAKPPPADRFETRGMVYNGHKFQPAVRPAVAETITAVTQQIQGIGCCSGVVRGPARVVRDAQSAVLNQGDILVAERTDPGWIMLFAAASGLLVERGSLLSHSAIVSREMGIPGIVALTGIMDWVKDGDMVEMDGSTGIVRRILPENQHAE
jgi:pyruvate,water dikinase